MNWKLETMPNSEILKELNLFILSKKSRGDLFVGYQSFHRPKIQTVKGIFSLAEKDITGTNRWKLKMCTLFLN